MISFDLFELAIVVVVFTLAGVVKGVIGLGLPTIAMGLLGALMTPGQAAAILIVAALLTNARQMWDGPALPILLRRLWPMLACALLGTLPAAGILTKANIGLTTALLGAILIAYALIGLVGVEFKVSHRAEAALGPLVGLTTGLINGATGIFVIPGVPYVQSLDFGKDELVQALALSAFVSSIALALGLGLNHASTARSRFRRRSPWRRRLQAWRSARRCARSCRSRCSGDLFSSDCWRWAAAWSRVSFCKFVVGIGPQCTAFGVRRDPPALRHQPAPPPDFYPPGARARLGRTLKNETLKNKTKK
jgi:uncharacterized protein